MAAYNMVNGRFNSNRSYSVYTLLVDGVVTIGEGTYDRIVSHVVSVGQDDDTYQEDGYPQTTVADLRESAKRAGIR